VTTQWKYKVIVLENDTRANARRLTKYGSAGWELVAVGDHKTKRLAYLKRPEGDPPALCIEGSGALG
jgi:hypothetical protein